MNKEEYTKMFKLEKKHFWFVGKRLFIDALITPRKKNINSVLDIGCGTGGTTLFLNKFGDVEAIEGNKYAVILAKKRGVKVKLMDINSFNLTRKFDLITVLDVLYHQKIKDEVKVLKRISKNLKKGGYLLITDSALPILSSSHDVAVHGRTRYTLKHMENIVKQADLKVIKASYVFFSIFPVVFAQRLIEKIFRKKSSDVKAANPVINRLLIFLLKAESFLLKFISFPIGSSVIILAEK